MPKMDLKRLFILIIILIIYLCLGSITFTALEAEAEKERMNSLKKLIQRFIENHTCVDMHSVLGLLDQTTRDRELIHYVVANKTNLDRWDFGGAFGFAVSVVTTIGFGNMAPFTLGGKIVCVCYALIGIPITVIMLNVLGQKLALLFAKMNRLKLCSRKPQVNRILNMVLIITLGICIMFVGPAAIFSLVEDWHFMEALYFCFITLSTIGFGDYIIGIHEKMIESGPGRDAYEITGYVWILFGLAYLSLVIKYITDVLATNAGKVERKTMRKLETEIGRIQGDVLKDRVGPALKRTLKSKAATENSVRLEFDEKKSVQLVRINHI